MRALLSALVLAAAFTGCGTASVDSADIEQGIESQVVAAGGKATKVECPSDIESKAGQSFNCSATFDNGATGKVKVTEPKKGRFEYGLVPGSLQVPGSVFEESIQTQLAQQGSHDATVNCPDNVIVKVGTYATCNVKSAGGQASGEVTFTFSDASGTVDESSVKTTS